MGRGRRSGFTLVELMIVVAILVTVAAITIPNLLSARLTSNETAAIASLKTLSTAESLMRSANAIDQDGDGIGEFGWLAEMGGTVNLRDATGPNNGPVMQPTLLAQSLARVDGNGIVTKSGYVYRAALPGAGGAPVVEQANGGSPTGEEADLCEVSWVVQAWPMRYANSGRRAFAVNEFGDVIQTDNLGGPGVYEGTTSMPAADAATENGAAGTITGAFSISGLPAAAVDGKTWKPVN